MPSPRPPGGWAGSGLPRPPRATAHLGKPRKPKKIKVTIPGFTPDWDAVIANDPRFMQRKGALAGLSAKDKAARNAKLIENLIAFGSLPDLTGVDLGDFGIDADTRAAILANTNPNTSTTARLQRENQTNVQALQDMLAARGMLRSGSLGTGLRLEQEDYTGRQTRARTELLNILKGLQGAFAEAEQGRQDELYGPGGLAEDVKEDLQESGLYETREASTVTARKDPATGLYKDAMGNYYDRNGNRVSPGRATGPQTVGIGARKKRPRQTRLPYVPGFRP